MLAVEPILVKPNIFWLGSSISNVPVIAQNFCDTMQAMSAFEYSLLVRKTI